MSAAGGEVGQCLEEGQACEGFSGFVFKEILHLFDFVASAKITSVFFLKVLIQNGSAKSWSLFAFQKNVLFFSQFLLGMLCLATVICTWLPSVIPSPSQCLSRGLAVKTVQRLKLLVALEALLQ